MIIRVQSVNFNASSDLIEFVQKKMDKLDQFFDHIVDGDVYLKLDNNHEKENKIAELKVNVPGTDLIVKKQSASFEEAIDSGTEALRKQLSKRKEKIKGL
jgi:putative sigma-54 modulation protein